MECTFEKKSQLLWRTVFKRRGAIYVHVCSNSFLKQRYGDDHFEKVQRDVLEVMMENT